MGLACPALVLSQMMISSSLLIFGGLSFTSRTCTVTGTWLWRLGWSGRRSVKKLLPKNMWEHHACSLQMLENHQAFKSFEQNFQFCTQRLCVGPYICNYNQLMSNEETQVMQIPICLSQKSTSFNCYFYAEVHLHAPIGPLVGSG